MSSEIQEQKKSVPKNDAAKKRSEIRWGWVLLGVLLLIFALIFPSLAARFYTCPEINRCWGANTGNEDVKIPDEPTSQSKSYRQKNRKYSEQINKENNSLLNINSNVFQTKQGLKFRSGDVKKTIGTYYNHSSTLTPLAHQFAESKTANTVKFVNPTPTIPPKSIDKKERNVFQKIFEWIVGLFKKKKKPIEITTLSLSKKTVKLPCPRKEQAAADSCSDSPFIQVTTSATESNNPVLNFDYKVTGGSLEGRGANVIWNLSGVNPGTYSITARINDNRENFSKEVTDTISVINCVCPQECNCPSVSVTASERLLRPGEPATFVADLDRNQDGVIYNWAVDRGMIVAGQGTPVIMVNTNETPDGGQVTATVNVLVTGCNKCQASAQTTVEIAVRASPNDNQGIIRGRVVDSLGNSISNAEVTIKNLETQRTFSVRTNANDFYEFRQLEPGDYVLRAESLNLRSNGQIVRVSNDEPRFEDVLVRPGMANINRDPASVNGNTKSSANLNTSANSGSNSNSNANININSNNLNADSNINANYSGNDNISNSSGNDLPLKTPDKEGTDKITFTYPVYFLKGTAHFVDLKLEFVKGKVIATTTTFNSNNTIVTRKDDSVVIKPPPPDSEIYVDAELKAVESLQEPKLLKGGWQKYIKVPGLEDTPSWKWQLNLNEAAKDSENVLSELRLSYGFKPKNSADKSPALNQTSLKPIPLKGSVGLPFWVWLLSYLGVPSGALMAVSGFVNRKEVEENIPKLVYATEPDVAVIEDEVQCTLYAPSEVKAGNDFVVQVFAHLQEQFENVGEIARMTDENIKKQAQRNLDKKIKRGSELTFQLAMSGVEIDDPIQKYLWNGSIIDVPFIVSVPPDQEPCEKRGKIIVSENSIPIGKLIFKINILAKINTFKPPDANLEQASLKRYQYAFISYASEDRPEVLERVQMLEAARIKYFQDVLNLNPGERWAKALYKHIDQSDVVFLFWSTAASKSEWVEKEVLYALERQQGNDTSPPDIIPIIIEGPPPVKPPATLNFLHFNDRFVYFIHAAEAEHNARNQANH